MFVILIKSLLFAAKGSSDDVPQDIINIDSKYKFHFSFC